MACFDVCPSLVTTTFFEATSGSTEDTPAIFSLKYEVSGHNFIT